MVRVRQSILDYANEVSSKCSCGGKHILGVSVTMSCVRVLEGHEDCTQIDPIELQDYEVKPGEQFFLVVNANKGFTAVDMLRGVQQANKEVFGVK